MRNSNTTTATIYVNAISEDRKNVIVGVDALRNHLPLHMRLYAEPALETTAAYLLTGKAGLAPQFPGASPALEHRCSRAMGLRQRWCSTRPTVSLASPIGSCN